MRLDLDDLKVETFELEVRCLYCGKLGNLDVDCYCELCGPVEARYDYRRQ